MKVSEITIQHLKEYAHVYHTDDDSLFTSILAACKNYIKSYTGLPLTRNPNLPLINPILPSATTITGESTNGYTITVKLNDGTELTTIVSGTTWTISIPTNKTLNMGDLITITQTNLVGNKTSPIYLKVGEQSTPYPPTLDDFEEISIALFVLANEMYDNRVFMVEGSNVNAVVQNILHIHSRNLL